MLDETPHVSDENDAPIPGPIAKVPHRRRKSRRKKAADSKPSSNVALVPRETSDTPLMRPHDVALILAIHPRTLANWRCAKVAPDFVTLPGGRIRYDPEAIRKFQAEIATPRHKRAGA